MGNEEQQQGEEVLSGNEKGIYTLTASDLQTIARIEDARGAYVMGLDEMSRSFRMEKFKNLLSQMQVFMEAYHFDEYLRRTKVNNYTFYFVVSNVDETDGDIDFIRYLSNISFTIWKNVLRILGVGLPTYRAGVKKKITDSLFSMVYNEIDVDKLVKEFDATAGTHTKFDFFCFCVSRMRDYDLDFNMSWVGKARSSKTSGMATMFEKVYEYRGVDLYSEAKGRPLYEAMLDQRMIFDQQKAIDAFKSGDGDVNWIDESYKVVDRRRSVSKKQIELTGDANFYASKKPINIKLIQNYSDLDLRTTSKDNAVLINTGRGEGLLFADMRFIALAKDQFGFEELISNPNILKYPPMAIHMLKRQSSYVCELEWPKRKAWEDNGVIHGAKADPLYAYCLKLKLEAQARVEVEKKSVKEQVKETGKTKRKIIEMYNRGGMMQTQIARELDLSKAYVSDVVNGKV